MSPSNQIMLAGPQMPKRIKFPGLTSLSFQHDWDRQATAHLGAIPGLDWLIARVIEYGIERKAYVINIGSNLRVGPQQLPAIYAMLQEACSILDMAEPELYIAEGGVNAHTSGHDKPYIVLLSGLVELLDEDELMAVIAHELGHIKCRHLLYQMMAGHLTMLLDLIPGAARFASQGIDVAFLNWSRRAELSADRAALLVVQDARPCLTLLMKMAGGTRRWAHEMNLEAFLDQANQYNEAADASLIDRWYQFSIGSKVTHPFAVERAKLLNQWSKSEHYAQMLSGSHRVPYSPPDAAASPQEKLRRGLGSVRDRALDATQGFIDKNRPAKPDEK